MKTIKRISAKRQKKLFDFLLKKKFVYSFYEPKKVHIFKKGKVQLLYPNKIDLKYFISTRTHLDFHNILEAREFHHIFGIEQVGNKYYWTKNDINQKNN